MSLRTLTVVCAAMVLFTAPAFAAVNLPADIWDPLNPSDELNVYEIYNALYGTAFLSSADLIPFVIASDEVFNFGSSDVLVEAEARYAGSIQHFGYYQPTGVPGAVLTELFVANTGGLLSGSPSSTINPVGDFGFYLDPQGGRAGSSLWFSEEALNGGEDHMILYSTPIADTYLMAWADLPLTITEDLDYNDLVVELTVGPRNVVPEPASLVLLGLGLSTMALRRLKKSR